MTPTDPRYIRARYDSGEHLAVISETHLRYGVAREDVFQVVTRTLVDMACMPTSILGIGAGTGNWYRSVRELLGADPKYTGLDQSRGMVQALESQIAADPHASVMVGHASALPSPDGSFDALGDAFCALLPPRHAGRAVGGVALGTQRGVLVCATNGRRPHYELWDLQEQAARRLGLPGAESAVTASDRFNLDNGADLFPMPPQLFRWPAGFRFDDAGAVMRCVAAGPLRKHLGSHADDPGVRSAALEWIGHEVQRIIDRHGVFAVHSKVGFFLLRRA